MLGHRSIGSGLQVVLFSRRTPAVRFLPPLLSALYWHSYMVLFLLALHPPGALLTQPLLASTRPCLSRGPSSIMRSAPPAGFEWGNKDREAAPDRLLRQLNPVLDRVVRVGNHVPAFTSLAYFGLISMTMQNMQMPAMGPMVATLKTVITKAVGPTTNKAFSQLFATLVTPAPFVFLIWPVIALLQLLTVTFSAFRPGAPMSQSELTSLALANAAATGWLLTSSNSAAGALPLLSVLLLPLVPFFSGGPLRAAAPPRGWYRPVFEVFSSFTTLASFLALAVELQYGGRVALLAGRAEPCALIFLGLTAAVVSLAKRTPIKKAVNLLALSGTSNYRHIASIGHTTYSYRALRHQQL